MDSNITAFANTIGQLESGGRYDILTGGSTFTDYSQFPTWDGYVSPDGSISHAAGKYQFQPATWAGLASQLGLMDFSPASQDAAAAQLIINKGADTALSTGDTATAVSKLKTTWTSLAAHSITTINADYTNFGGTVAQTNAQVNTAAANNILQTVQNIATGVQTFPNGTTIDNSTVIAIAVGVLFVIIGYIFYLVKKKK